MDTTELLAAAVDALGGANRPGQVAMAEAVSRAMETDRHLAVQAGTGTGKSLAYLVPAIRHAQETGSTIIVSTATIALQKQLVDRDLPRLAEALAPHLKKRPTFAIMKGRQNYFCLNKIADTPDLELADEQENLSWLGRHITRLYDWASETETGDRDSLEPGVPDIAWRQVSVSAKECIGAIRCPHGEMCFAERARHQAKDVDVVVTNHAMLAIDAMVDVNVLPEHDIVIIDEAHELDARITSVSTTDIGLTALNLSARRAGKLGAEGKEDKLFDVAKQWEQAMLGINPGRVTQLPSELEPTLIALADSLYQLREAIYRPPEGEAAHDPERHAERLALTNHLGDQHEAVIRIMEVFKEPDITQQEDVVWAEINERRGVFLKVAPLSVSGLLQENLFNRNTVILTSATLALGGKFDALATDWGLPPGTWDQLDAGTPFDPRRSGILYTPRHLPFPGRDGLADAVIEEIYDLIMATGGRTLGLFSSRRAAEQAAQALKSRIPFDLLCQGEDTTGALVERFAKQENTCLFGTLSLWQGVDVPGKSCSLVIMDRIPFPRPDDPLLQARKEAADAAGRNGFMEVATTHAGLLMAQGAGRLMRSINDKGVVAILDKRIVEKRYGSFLINSLPQFWRTTDKATVIGALQRLVAVTTRP